MTTIDSILGGNLSRHAFLSRLAIIAGGSAVALACGSDALPSHPPPPVHQAQQPCLPLQQVSRILQAHLTPSNLARHQPGSLVAPFSFR
ncbi:MAG TPA: hypothetical protein EYQ67_11445 [Dehalococcoidia bacterium]|nr:hypothetical protein [Dehalococcoidia bacterium]